MAGERVDIVDEHDRVVGVATRAEMRRRNLLHRATGTFVFCSDARLFVQRRTLTKDLFPGLHDVCVGGTVTHGETGDENAVRELAEELGIRSTPVYFLFRHRFEHPRTRTFSSLYACVWDGPLTLQPEEVAGGDWLDELGVEALVAAGRVCPDTARAFDLFRARYGGFGDFLTRTLPRLTPVGPARGQRAGRSTR